MDRRILRRLAKLGHGRRDGRRISLLADCLHGRVVDWPGTVGQWGEGSETVEQLYKLCDCPGPVTHRPRAHYGQDTYK